MESVDKHSIQENFALDYQCSPRSPAVNAESEASSMLSNDDDDSKRDETQRENASKQHSSERETLRGDIQCPKCEEKVKEVNYVNHIMNCTVSNKPFDANSTVRVNEEEELNDGEIRTDSITKKISSISEVYSAMQQKQQLQMQLIRDIQSQILRKTYENNGLDSLNRETISSNHENEDMNKNKAIQLILEKMKPNSINLDENSERDDYMKSNNKSQSGLVNSEILSPEIPISTEMNNLEKLQETTDHVLNEASHGLFTNRFIAEANSFDPQDSSAKNKCKFCGKVFGSDSGLQIHLRSHTGERPFKCNICGNRFTTRGNLKVHFQRHQSRFPTIKMNQNPVPEHLDKFYVPLLAQLGEMEPSRPAPTGPPNPFPANPPAGHLNYPPQLESRSLDMGFKRDFASFEDTRNTENRSSPSNNSEASSKSYSNENGSSAPKQTESENPLSYLGLNSDLTKGSAALPQISHGNLENSALNHAFNQNIWKILHEQRSNLQKFLAQSGNVENVPFLLRFNKDAVQSQLFGHQNPVHNPFLYSNILSKSEETEKVSKEAKEQESTNQTSKLETFVNNIENDLSNPNQCSVCHRTFSGKSAVIMHMRIHTGERPYKCDMCAKTFTTKGNMKAHMSVHRERPAILVNQCPLCDKKFNSILHLQQHIHSHKSSMDLRPVFPGLRDVMRPFPLFNLPNLKPELAQFYPFPKYPEPEITSKYNQTNERNSMDVELNEESEDEKDDGLRKEQNERTKTCDNPNSISPHEENSTLEFDTEGASVNQKEKSSRRSDDEYSSENTHSTDPVNSLSDFRLSPPFPFFNGYQNLIPSSNQHYYQMLNSLRKSSQAAPGATTCKICRKTLSSSSALEIHMRSHTRDRPFLCTYCDRRFTTRGNMRQHMVTHKNHADSGDANKSTKPRRSGSKMKSNAYPYPNTLSIGSSFSKFDPRSFEGSSIQNPPTEPSLQALPGSIASILGLARSNGMTQNSIDLPIPLLRNPESKSHRISSNLEVDDPTEGEAIEQMTINDPCSPAMCSPTSVPLDFSTTRATAESVLSRISGLSEVSTSSALSETSSTSGLSGISSGSLISGTTNGSHLSDMSAESSILNQNEESDLSQTLTTLPKLSLTNEQTDSSVSSSQNTLQLPEESAKSELSLSKQSHILQLAAT